jgi:hypothetical protein
LFRTDITLLQQLFSQVSFFHTLVHTVRGVYGCNGRKTPR